MSLHFWPSPLASWLDFWSTMSESWEQHNVNLSLMTRDRIHQNQVVQKKAQRYADRHVLLIIYIDGHGIGHHIKKRMNNSIIDAK